MVIMVTPIGYSLRDIVFRQPRDRRLNTSLTLYLGEPIIEISWLFEDTLTALKITDSGQVKVRIKSVLYMKMVRKDLNSLLSTRK